MKKRSYIYILLAILSLVLALFLVYAHTKNLGAITGGTVSGQTKCLEPKAALLFINTKGCWRIYESASCLEQGKVEVQC